MAKNLLADAAWPIEEAAPKISKKKAKENENPCDSCPLNDGRNKVPPYLPPNPTAIAIGLAPGPEDEKQLKYFVGPAGQIYSKALVRAKMDPARVAIVALTRCRPTDDIYDPKGEWGKAVKVCSKFFKKDIAPYEETQTPYEETQTPFLLLGQQVVRTFLGEKGNVMRDRGLWTRTKKGLMVFPARHPSAPYHAEGPEKTRLMKQYLMDMRRFANQVIDPNASAKTLIPITGYRSLGEAVPFLQALKKARLPWAFDLETYDRLECPSRDGVATDPCNSDFAVRGIGFGVSNTKGFYIDLLTNQGLAFSALDKVRNRLADELAFHKKRSKSACANCYDLLGFILLNECFETDTEKWGFNAHFDQEGLEFRHRWVREVRNRLGDGMLAAIALGDTTQSSNTLARLVVEALGENQYWDGADKSRMFELPFEQVRDGCGNDAVKTRKLVERLHQMLADDQYLETQ